MTDESATLPPSPGAVGARAVPTTPGAPDKTKTDLGRDTRWCLWSYALQPGWERTGEYATREEARDVRAELVEEDGYPPEWVSVRRAGADGPKRRPPQATIDALKQAIASGEGR
jgi:hypothetical protein